MSEPDINIRASFSSHAVGDNPHPTRVVIHSTCPTIGYSRASMAGQAQGTAQYFASAKAGGSAHYIVDVATEEHCVPDTTIAYHAPPNVNSLGIEICSEGGNYAQSYTRDQWLSSQVWPAVVRAARRTAELCDRFGIPKVKLTVSDLLEGKHGICGHVDVSTAWHQSTHSDPGPGFPWDEFIKAVNGAVTPAGGSTPPPPAFDPAHLPVLTRGMTANSSVAALQRFLNAYNWVPALPLLPLTGNYLDQTVAVVRSAQAQMGITGPDADGTIVGPRTNAALAQRGYRG